MTEERYKRYEVKIVFRGLFLACIHESKMKDGTVEVLLPDASWPGRLIGSASGPLRELLLHMQPLREHQAVFEFPVADWDNHSALMPGLIQVDKPTKEPVGLFFLRGHRIRFRALWGGDGALPDSLVEEESLYTVLAEKPQADRPDLVLLREHTDHGFDQLPGFSGTPRAAGEERDRECAAVTTFTFGEVYTERRSKKSDQDRQWEELHPSEIEKPQDPENARPINLDLVVRFSLPVTDSLLVVCEALEPGGPEARQFILSPSDVDRGVTVWVKNRELDAILFDSDLLPDPFDLDCPDTDNVDRDHAFYMRLTEQPADLKVPRSLGNEASDCGSGCGGCGHPPPKPPGG